MPASRTEQILATVKRPTTNQEWQEYNGRNHTGVEEATKALKAVYQSELIIDVRESYEYLVSIYLPHTLIYTHIIPFIPLLL